MENQAFSHKAIEIKREFLRLARSYHDKSNVPDKEDAVAYELAAALIFMNLADYLAQYLAYGVTTMASDAVGEYYFGAISMDRPQTRNITIGDSIKILKNYEFPRSKDIRDALGSANKSRKKLAHEILKIDADKLEEVDQAIRDLRRDVERLIEIVDQVQAGMPPKTIKG